MDTSDLAEFKSIMEQGAERYRADQARIAALEAQLAASEARCAELDGAARADEQRLRGAAECAGVGWFGCDTPEVLADTIGALRVDLAAALARAEEAERVAVWAVRSGVRANDNGMAWGHKHGRWLPHDGTDAGILAALRQAEEATR